MKVQSWFVLVLAACLAVACGRASASASHGAATVTPEPPASAAHAISVVLVPGAAPDLVAARILGRPAFVQPAWRGGANPPPLTRARANAYVIPVLPSEEQEALLRAESDKAVTYAQLVPWPLEIP